MHGPTESKREQKLSLDSPLSAIARQLAHMYFYRKFAKTRVSGGELLDYDGIRDTPINTQKLPRPLHGFQNAARTAAAIPGLFAIYKKYLNLMMPEIRKQALLVDALWIKKLQIVALMRSTGRTVDTGKGSESCLQAQKECLHFLKYLGMHPEEAEEWSQILIATEGSQKTDFLGSSLLADVAIIETFRDFSPEKNIQLSWFPFYTHLDPKVYKKPAIIDFIALCSHHACVIQAHQGYIFHALRDDQGQPVKGWPALDSRSVRNARVENTQKIFEYDEKYFEKCEAVLGSKEAIYNAPEILQKNTEEPAFFTSHLWEKQSLAYSPDLLHHLDSQKTKIHQSGTMSLLEMERRRLESMIEMQNEMLKAGMQAREKIRQEEEENRMRDKDLPYAELKDKFGGCIPPALDKADQDMLNHLNGIIKNCMGLYRNAYRFEIRLSHFDPETGIASGPLKSIMLKIPLATGSNFMDMNTFKCLWVNALKKQLGGNYNRLVIFCGEAVDRSACVDFSIKELRKGLFSDPDHKSSPGFGI